MRLILDTCAFLWLSMEPGRLPLSVREIVESRSSVLLLSVSSIWKIGIKWGLGRLALPARPRDFITEAVDCYFLTVLPVSQHHALAAAELTRHHGDPFDRMLIAQSMIEGVPIATPDGHFGRYPVQTVW